MVPLVLDKGRSVRANLSIDAGLIEAIDAEAKRRGLTRSSFLASAALDKLMARAGGESPHSHTLGQLFSVPNALKYRGCLRFSPGPKADVS